MPDLPKGWSSTGVKPRRMAGRRGRGGGIIWLLLFGLAFLIGGITMLVLGVVRVQDAARLAAAPVCASAQQAGCRLDERVTVVDIETDYYGRGGTSRIVKVQTPDAGTQIVYATDHDAGLWSRLSVNEALNAELWNGFVIRLDDGAGHYLLADDSPAVTGVLFIVLGALEVIVGGLLLVLCVRLRLRQRSASR